MSLETAGQRAEDLRFTEIEHKFVLDEGFDWPAFSEQLRGFQPEREYKTSVTDTYFLLKASPQLVYRHRFDGLLQHLSCKSVSSQDSEARTEINLELDLEAGNQLPAVEAFLRPMGIIWQGALRKDVQVFYFPDVEIVHYRASFEGRSVRCLELEVRTPRSRDEAVALLERWEVRLGLDPKARSHQSLLHLLIVDALPSELRDKLSRL